MLKGMSITDLDIIEGESGSIFHVIKNLDPGFVDFGEVYFSTVHKGAIKAWKMHERMTLNLVVPIGSVLFNFIDYRDESGTFNKTYKIVLSQQPYRRLTVPPGIWFGFKGLSSKMNLVCNVADLPHDPNEVVRKKIDEIKIDWNIE